MFTEITDGIDAARVASEIEEELVELLGEADVSTEAERHWSEPYNYELTVTIVPARAAGEALQAVAAAGGEAWLACRDDGWRCELWWSSTRDPDAILIVPEVRAAEVAALIPVVGPRPAARTASGRSSPSACPRAQTLRRAMKKPEVPCRCGVVSRNSGRLGCANCGQSPPSGSGSSPTASTTASFSSAFSVQTE